MNDRAITKLPDEHIVRLQARYADRFTSLLQKFLPVEEKYFPIQE